MSLWLNGTDLQPEGFSLVFGQLQEPPRTTPAANTMDPMFASVIQYLGRISPILWVSVSASLFLGACGGAPAPSVSVPSPVARAPVSEPATQASLPPDEAPVPTVSDDQAPVIIALLLPLSGAEEDTGQALLRAATMALFDAYDPSIRIHPLDTAADPDRTEVQAREAVSLNASIVLGPLLATNVQIAGDILEPAGIPMIGFSNDSRVASAGRFIMGFLPEAEVKRVVDHAVTQDLTNFGALVPMGRYGSRIRTAFGDAAADAGATVAAIESYPPDPDALFEPVKRLARYDERRDEVRQEVRFLRSLRDDLTDEIAQRLEDAEVMEGVDFDAVLVPEGGALMRTLAPLLPFYEIDPNRVRLLGTGLWNDEGLLGEPPLQGAWFAAPDPEASQEFLARYQSTFDVPAPRLATLAYDAVSLVARLAREPVEETGNALPEGASAADLRFAKERFLVPEGFVGVDGLFRFLPDGTTERALAILEVNRRGFRVIDPAPPSFPAFGYALKN